MEMRDKIKALRAKLGVDQEGLASLVGVAQSTVSRWEEGATPGPERIKRMAELAGVTVDEFMSVSDGSDPAADFEGLDIFSMAEAYVPPAPAMPASISVAEIIAVLSEDDGGLYTWVSREVIAALGGFGIVDEQMIRKGVALTYHKLAKGRR